MPGNWCTIPIARMNGRKRSNWEIYSWRMENRLMSDFIWHVLIKPQTSWTRHWSRPTKQSNWLKEVKMTKTILHKAKFTRPWAIPPLQSPLIKKSLMANTVRWPNTKSIKWPTNRLQKNNRSQNGLFYSEQAIFNEKPGHGEP